MTEASPDAEIRPFRFEVPQADLDGLHDGLGREVAQDHLTIITDDGRKLFRPLR